METIEVDAPYSVTLDSLERRVRGHHGRFHLVVPFRDLGLPGPLGLEREVSVEFLSVRGLKGQKQLYDEMNLRWEPVGGGPYPHFEGQFKLRPLGTHTELTLHGAYDPPLGVIGDVFDAVIGQKIAQATGRVLLAELKKNLETDYLTVRETIEGSPERHE